MWTSESKTLISNITFISWAILNTHMFEYFVGETTKCIQSHIQMANFNSLNSWHNWTANLWIYSQAIFCSKALITNVFAECFQKL